MHRLFASHILTWALRRALGCVLSPQCIPPRGLSVCLQCAPAVPPRWPVCLRELALAAIELAMLRILMDWRGACQDGGRRVCVTRRTEWLM